MLIVNRTSSMPNSVLHYFLDKAKYLDLEFSAWDYNIDCLIIYSHQYSNSRAPGGLTKTAYDITAWLLSPTFVRGSHPCSE